MSVGMEIVLVLERGTTGQRINTDGETWKLRAGDEFWPHRFCEGNWRNMEKGVSNASLAGMAIRQTISHVSGLTVEVVIYFKSNNIFLPRSDMVKCTNFTMYSEYYFALRRRGKPCPDRAAALSGDCGGADWPRRVSISAYLTC